MPPKKKTSSTRGRGKGKKTPPSSSSKPIDPPVDVLADIPDPSADILDTPADDDPDVPERSRSPTPPRERSRESSVSSSVSIAVSTSSRPVDDKGKEKKKKRVMLEFIRDNPVLWNVKMTDYRRKDKKNKIWEDQARLMNKTADTLKGWFRSLPDTHTLLDKKKSGDGAPYLTEREEWIISKFVILKTVARQFPEPLQSVKATSNSTEKTLMLPILPALTWRLA